MANSEGGRTSSKASQNGQGKFQPDQHLTQRDGNNYLPLKWKLAWLRSEFPQAEINTKLHSHEGGLAIFQAEVKLPGGGTATGWGAHARHGDDPDNGLHYLTLAENQALERALAVLGYGTEYASDFDLPEDADPITLPTYTVDDDDRIELSPTIEIEPTPPPAAKSEPKVEPKASPAPAKAAPPPPPPAPVAQADEDEDDEEEPEDEDTDEDDEDDEEEETAPTPIRRVAENRPPDLKPVPPRAPERPAAPVRMPPSAQPVAPVASTKPQIGNQVVTDRLRDVSDEKLRFAFKNIYNEARRLHNLDEDVVDSRSVKRYNKPVYELTADEAEEYLEVIKSAAARRQPN